MNNRKPVHLEYSGGKSPRQQIWEKIRHLKTFTLSQLVGELSGAIHRDTTRTYINSLQAAGFLAPVGGDIYSVCYELQRDNGVEAPKVRRDGSFVEQGRRQENMWRTLRTTTQPLSSHELAMLASISGHEVSHEFSRDYLLNLEKAGYVHRIGARSGGDKFKLNSSHDTGPRPPMIQRTKQIYDQNLGRVVWIDKNEAGNYE